MTEAHEVEELSSKKIGDKSGSVSSYEKAQKSGTAHKGGKRDEMSYGLMRWDVQEWQSTKIPGPAIAILPNFKIVTAVGNCGVATQKEKPQGQHCRGGNFGGILQARNCFLNWRT